MTPIRTRNCNKPESIKPFNTQGGFEFFPHQWGPSIRPRSSKRRRGLSRIEKGKTCSRPHLTALRQRLGPTSYLPLTKQCHKRLMNPETFLAWKSLYLSVAICSLLCATITAAAVAWQITHGHWSPNTQGRFPRLLYIPRIWWRWRMLYFSGFPTIMLIIVLYVAHLGVTVLTNV